MSLKIPPYEPDTSKRSGKTYVFDPIRKRHYILTPEEHVTLSDILCHRVGMRTFQGDFMTFNSDLTSEEVIVKMGNLTPEYDFRTKWGYYNTGFLIAGEAIANITKSSWADFMKERFFIPLDMNETIALASQLDGVKNKASAHTRVQGELKVIDYSNFDQLAPAGAISSSVNDMSHWLIAQLSDGFYKGKEVIPVSVITKTRIPHSIIGNGWSLHNRSNFSLYGLGWNLSDYEGHKIVSHTGGLEGFVSSVTLVPDEFLGIVILTNTDDNNLFISLKSEIIDAFLGLPYRDYATFYREYSEKTQENKQHEINKKRDSVNMNIATPIELISYEGYYVHEVYGYILIEVDKNKLMISFEHHPTLTASLEYIGNDRFLCTYSKPAYGIKVLPFSVLNSRGYELTLKVADFVEYNDYKFVRMAE